MLHVKPIKVFFFKAFNFTLYSNSVLFRVFFVGGDEYLVFCISFFHFFLLLLLFFVCNSTTSFSPLSIPRREKTNEKEINGRIKNGRGENNRKNIYEKTSKVKKVRGEARANLQVDRKERKKKVV